MTQGLVLGRSCCERVPESLEFLAQDIWVHFNTHVDVFTTPSSLEGRAPSLSLGSHDFPHPTSGLYRMPKRLKAGKPPRKITR